MARGTAVSVCVCAGGRGGAARGAAARVARVPVRGAVAGAVPRARGAARRGAGGRHARARAAGAAGAAGLLARRLPAPRAAPLRRARPARLVLPPARAAVGQRRHRVQQGAGVPRAALRAPRAAQRGGLRHGAGAPAPRARYVRASRSLCLSPPPTLDAYAYFLSVTERYRSLDTKMKSNPLSLEEVRDDPRIHRSL